MAGSLDLRDKEAQKRSALALFIHPKCFRNVTGLTFDVGAVLTEPFEMKSGTIDVLPRSAYYFDLDGLSRTNPPVVSEYLARKIHICIHIVYNHGTVQTSPIR